MSTPIVSVVMSVFNGEQYLGESVESILRQTFADFEFIIIDDGSTDGTAAMLDRYQQTDARVRVLRQGNKGLVNALNRGCGFARGKYIVRMDADDVAVENRLIWQVEFMEEHPEVGVLGGAVDVVDTSGKWLKTSVNPATDEGIRSILPESCPIWHSTVAMRKDVFDSVGGYRKAVFGAEDYDLWLRAAESCRLANLAKVLLVYRLHPCQVTVSKVRQIAFSTLAAQAAAAARKKGMPDGLEEVTEITPEVLVRLGVSESMQQAALADRYLWSIGTLYNSAEYSMAFMLFTDMLQCCEWKQARRRITADLRLLGARLYLRQGKYLKGALIAVHATVTRPIIIGRLVKPLLRMLQLY